MASVNLNLGPPFRAKNCWPSSWKVARAFGTGAGFSVTDYADQLGIFEDGNVEVDGLFGVVIEP